MQSNRIAINIKLCILVNETCMNETNYHVNRSAAMSVQLNTAILISLQHTTRTFHNLQGQVESRDSGLWINSFDFTGMQHITPLIPEISDTVRTRCQEDRPFCGYPWFLPVKFLSRSAQQPCGSLCNNFICFITKDCFYVCPKLFFTTFFDVFVGKTGTSLPQKCPQVLLWSSASCPERIQAGGPSR